MIRRPPRYTPTDTPFPYTARFRPNSQQVGTDAAAKVVNVEQVVAMVGPFCSGETLAAANTVNIPAGVVMISPSATSPELTTLKDNDLVFRTAPSDSFQGQALARKLLADGTEIGRASCRERGCQYV